MNHKSPFRLSPRSLRPAGPVMALALQLAALPALASPPEIVSARAERSTIGWKISVTLRHDDTGWDHFADRWQVTDEAGNVLATRELTHPHVNEQPFTRALQQVVVPDGTRRVYIRAHCSQTGWSETRFKLKLSRH